jgi:hypothetical protein
MDPIIGLRYLCNECDESHEVDLCEDCYVEESFENGKILILSKLFFIYIYMCIKSIKSSFNYRISQENT